MKRKKENEPPRTTQQRADSIVARLSQHAYLAKWGLTDFYDDVRPQVVALFDLDATYKLGWGAKKEIEFCTVERNATGTITITATTQMDDGDDLVDTLLWVADEKREGAGAYVLSRERLDVETSFESLRDILRDTDLVLEENITRARRIVHAPTIPQGARFNVICAEIDAAGDEATAAQNLRYMLAVKTVQAWLKQHKDYPRPWPRQRKAPAPGSNGSKMPQDQPHLTELREEVCHD